MLARAMKNPANASVKNLLGNGSILEKAAELGIGSGLNLLTDRRDTKGPGAKKGN